MLLPPTLELRSLTIRKLSTLRSQSTFFSSQNGSQRWKDGYVPMPTRPERPNPGCCIVLLARGLMGSGKSTVMQMLSYLLGGSVVNQDEFAHFGRNARKKFLSAVAERGCMEDWLFVDKINTQVRHRTEILERIRDDGLIVLVNFRHPDDIDTFDHALGVCEERINKRQGGHRTLYPGPDLHGILATTVENQEPLTDDEKERVMSIDVDLTLSLRAMVRSVLHSLSLLRWENEKGNIVQIPIGTSGDGQSNGTQTLLARTEEDKSSVTQLPLSRTRGEEQSNGTQTPLARSRGEQSSVTQNPATCEESLTSLGGGQRTTRALPIPQFSEEDIDRAEDFVRQREQHIAWEMREAFRISGIYYVGIFFDQRSLRTLDALFEESCHTEHKKCVTEDLHTTLVFVDGKKVDLLDEVLAWEGAPVTLLLQAIAYDDRVVTVSVKLPEGVPCANRYPHVTLALTPGVPAVESNDLLAKVAEGTGKYHKLAPLELKGIVTVVPKK